MGDKNTLERRDFVRGLASLPVLGGFLAAALAKRSHDIDAQKRIFTDLGIDPELLEPERTKSVRTGDLIRLGIIGVGSRGTSILESLGFCRPEPRFIYADREPDLNIRLTGICDVYELHAERGIAMSARNRFAGKNGLPRARHFRDYRDLLASDEVDAVIIATPDHWHAQMIIDAVRAGKPIYCEKCLTRTIEEAYTVRDCLKNTNIVFQYGHQNRQQDSYRIARAILQKDVLGKITLIKTHTNRNNERGAWIRHKGEIIDPQNLDWKEWLGSAPVSYTHLRAHET